MTIKDGKTEQKEQEVYAAGVNTNWYTLGKLPCRGPLDISLNMCISNRIHILPQLCLWLHYSQ